MKIQEKKSIRKPWALSAGKEVNAVSMEKLLQRSRGPVPSQWWCSIWVWELFMLKGKTVDLGRASRGWCHSRVKNEQRVESQPDVPHMGPDVCSAWRCVILASWHGGKGLRYQLSRLHISANLSRWLSASCLAQRQLCYKKQLKAEWMLSKQSH